MKIIFKSFAVVSLLIAAQSSFSQVVLVVGAKSAAAGINAEQAANLFLGKSNELAGVGTALLLDLPESNPARDQFYTKVSGKSGAQVKAIWSKLVFSGKGTPPKEIASSAEVKKLVSTNANAIGYIEKGAVDASVKVLLTLD